MTNCVQLFGAVAVRPAILPLVSPFEAETGLALSSRWELNPVVKAQIEVGADFDFTAYVILVYRDRAVFAGQSRPLFSLAVHRVPSG